MAYDYLNSADESINIECRVDGNVLNGGGFASAYSSYDTGTDRSQSASPHVETTGGVTASTVVGSGERYKIALVNYTVSAADIGNLVQTSAASDSGAYSPALFMIHGVDTTANTWTMNEEVRDSSLDSSVATFTLRMGGAIPSVGLVGDWGLSSGDTPKFINSKYIYQLWVKKGASNYELTTDTDNRDGGPLQIGNHDPLNVIGYETTRGDGGRPVIDVASSGVTDYVFEFGSNYNPTTISNIEIDCAGTANGIKQSSYQKGTSVNCRVVGLGSGKTGVHQGAAIGCEAVGDGTRNGTGFAEGVFTSCVATNCANGFSNGMLGPQLCLAYDCTDGFRETNAQNRASANTLCVADGCDNGFYGHGVRAWISCVATNNTYGFNGVRTCSLFNCAGYNNTTQYNSDLITKVNWTVLGADPWENQSEADFRLNTAETGGQVLRSAGIQPIGQTADADKNFFTTAKSGSGSTTVVTPGPVQIGM